MMKAMNQQIQILNSAYENNEWIQSKIEDLRKEHENKFIAVENKELIAEDKDIKKIIKKIIKMKKNPAAITIEFINKKGFKMIL